MAVLIEGIGGTGKAVVNLLHFAAAAGQLSGHVPGSFLTAVVDQDQQGSWPGTDIYPAANINETDVRRALGIQTVIAECGAKALFSAANELALNIGAGFHGYPKVASSLPVGVSVGQPQVAAHVLVYSDIGGTGAGIGPKRLLHLLEHSTAKHVIAIVYGKYIDCATSAPVGCDWLIENARLGQNRDRRWFTAYYLDIPAIAANGSPPSSGLNPAATLLFATGFLWHLIQSDSANTLDAFLEINDRQNRREDVRVVTEPRKDFYDLDQDRGLVGRLRRCAVSEYLDEIAEGRPAVAAHLNSFLGSDGLVREAWSVFGAPMPSGTGLGHAVNYDRAFHETFTSVPDPWAAAEWFLRGVLAQPSGELAMLYRQLMRLYLMGTLHVLETAWVPSGGSSTGPIYALMTERLHADDNTALAARYDGATVGFFSPTFPFWTVAAYRDNLLSLANRVSARVDLPATTVRITENTPMGQALKRLAPAARTLPAVQNAGPSITFELVPQQQVSSWGWTVHAGQAKWDDLRNLLPRLPLLSQRLDVQLGHIKAGGTPAYQSTLRGVDIDQFLRSDRLQVDGRVGVQYYEIESVLTNASVLKRRAIIDAEDGITWVDSGGTLNIVLGNVELIVS